MKICRILYKEKETFGVLSADKIGIFAEVKTISDVKKESKVEFEIDATDVKFLSISVPTKIVCVGRNYAEHAAELGNQIPSEPLLFLKAPSSLILDGESIIIPKQSVQVEHEGELAVIIGRHCKNLGEQDDPLDYVFGYACLNDVTARDLQKKDVQFTRAKSFDTFCPIGSFIETDLDVSDINIKTTVNGVIKQNSSTSQMIFTVPFLINYISRQMTLNVGDIIATGTPSGVSKLIGGDSVEVEIEGIGKLKNFVSD